MSVGITCLVWNPNHFNNVHNTLLPVPALSQMNPFHALSSFSLNIRFNIVLSFMSKSKAANSRLRPRAPVKNIFLFHPSQGRPAKNLYPVLERQTISCRVNWAWSERVNLYSWKVMILPTNTKIHVNVTKLGPGSPSRPPGPGNLYCPPPTRWHGPNFPFVPILQIFLNKTGM